MNGKKQAIGILSMYAMFAGMSSVNGEQSYGNGNNSRIKKTPESDEYKKIKLAQAKASINKQNGLK